MLTTFLSIICLASAKQLVTDNVIYDDYQENKNLMNYFENENLTLHESDIIVFNNRPSNGMVSSAVSRRSAKWPEGKVPVKFSESFTNREKQKILDAMREMHDNTCIRFYHADEDDDDVLVIVKPFSDECSSMCGRKGGPQPLRLAHSCLTRRIILHELMHAIGFVHEHNRADRDDYVTVKWSFIKEEQKYNFKKHSWDELTLMETDYAYDSIMHYKGKEFGIHMYFPTLVANEEGVKMGGGERLSEIDILRINKLYRCEIEEPTTTEATTTTTTTTEEVPALEVTTTTEKPPRKIIACLNAYKRPVKDGQCRWLIMRTVVDPKSENHYLYCVPNNDSEDIRCGKWIRKECRRGTVFDPVLKFCRRTSFSRSLKWG